MRAKSLSSQPLLRATLVSWIEPKTKAPFPFLDRQRHIPPVGCGHVKTNRPQRVARLPAARPPSPHVGGRNRAGKGSLRGHTPERRCGPRIKRGVSATARRGIRQRQGDAAWRPAAPAQNRSDGAQGQPPDRATRSASPACGVRRAPRTRSLALPGAGSLSWTRQDRAHLMTGGKAAMPCPSEYISPAPLALWTIQSI